MSGPFALDGNLGVLVNGYALNCRNLAKPMGHKGGGGHDFSLFDRFMEAGRRTKQDRNKEFVRFVERALGKG